MKGAEHLGRGPARESLGRGWWCPVLAAWTRKKPPVLRHLSGHLRSISTPPPSCTQHSKSDHHQSSATPVRAKRGAPGPEVALSRPHRNKPTGFLRFLRKAGSHLAKGWGGQPVSGLLRFQDTPSLL